MKKADFIRLSLAFGVLLLLFACRKDIDFVIQGKDKPTSTLSESAKVWRLQRLDKSEVVRKHLSPRWDDSWTEQTASGKNIMIVPARENQVNNKDLKIRRFFIFTVTSQRVLDGHIVELVGNNYDVEGNLRFLIRNHESRSIAGFNGAVVRYDINYRYLSSSNFKEGRRTNVITRIFTQEGGALEKELTRRDGKYMSLNASSTTCAYISPLMLGWPPSFPSPGCRWTYRADFTYDEDTGCLHSLVHTYISHICSTPEEGSGSSGSGSGSGSGSSEEDNFYGEDPGDHGQTAPSSTQVREHLRNKPFALSNVPCPVVMKWLATARHKIAQAQVAKLFSIQEITTYPVPFGHPITVADIARVQDIDDALSTVVNMDYFPIRIQELPKINGQRLTAQQFLDHIRKNINNFVSSNHAVFTPYQWNGINDNNLWASNNPLNAVIGIDIVGPDNGSVIVSDVKPDRWTFTTIKEPHYGAHPVSGNRDFGYVQNTDGSYTFYTRGVDRLTGVSGSSLLALSNHLKVKPGFPLTQADELWMSFQTMVKEFTNNNSGDATIEQNQILRPDWEVVKKVLSGSLPLSVLSEDCPD